MCISQSVGQGAPNQGDDVALIQALINMNRALMPGLPIVEEDGIFGPATRSAIEEFQHLLATPGSTSGVIDPGSPTLTALRSSVGNTLDATVLFAVMPLTSTGLVAKYFDPLVAAMSANQINTPLRQAHFFAQIGHESGSLQFSEELSSGRQYEGRTDLGNTQPGDGPRFKGRGLIQITGRTNYTNYGNARQRDFVTGTNPSLLATDPNIAADCSGWFWTTRGLNGLADLDDLITITKRINGGTNGLDDRARRLKIAKCLLLP